MADDTTLNSGSGGDRIATDELATLNGVDVTGASPRIKAQRVKIEWGADGDATDASAANPLPAVGMGRAISLVDTTLSWANSDPINTEKTATLENALGGVYCLGRPVLIFVQNPSTETALTLQLRVKWTPSGGSAVMADVSTPSDRSLVNVLANNGNGQVWLFDSLLLVAGGQVSLKNAVALSGSGAFSAKVQAWTV